MPELQRSAVTTRAAGFAPPPTTSKLERVRARHTAATDSTRAASAAGFVTTAPAPLSTNLSSECASNSEVLCPVIIHILQREQEAACPVASARRAWWDWGSAICGHGRGSTRLPPCELQSLIPTSEGRPFLSTAKNLPQSMSILVARSVCAFSDCFV